MIVVRNTQRLNRYCFTLNNPLEKPVLDIENWDNVRLVVYQLEVGDEGTPHYQGYVEFTVSMRRNAVRRLPGLEEAAFFMCDGNRASNVRYCTKEPREDGPWYWPDKATCVAKNDQGKRTELQFACDLIAGGANDAAVAVQCSTTYVKFFRGLNKYRDAIQVERHRSHADGEIDSIYYVGPPDTGKSYRLQQECPPGSDWYWCVPGVWFDDYMGQTGLVFNEFSDNWYGFRYLCQLIDNSPFTVQTKGGKRLMKATHFRFSSNIKPRNLYKKLALPWDATNPLYRRFNNVILMKEVYVRPVAVPRVDECEDDSWEDQRDADAGIDLINAVPGQYNNYN